MSRPHRARPASTTARSSRTANAARGVASASRSRSPSSASVAARSSGPTALGNRSDQPPPGTPQSAPLRRRGKDPPLEVIHSLGQGTERLGPSPNPHPRAQLRVNAVRRVLLPHRGLTPPMSVDPPHGRNAERRQHARRGSAGGPELRMGALFPGGAGVVAPSPPQVTLGTLPDGSADTPAVFSTGHHHPCTAHWLSTPRTTGRGGLRRHVCTVSWAAIVADDPRTARWNLKSLRHHKTKPVYFFRKHYPHRSIRWIRIENMETLPEFLRSRDQAKEISARTAAAAATE